MNSKQVNETVNKLVSFMQDVKNGDLRTILENMQKMNDYMAEKLRIMQKMNDYMAEKLRIYEEHLTSLTGKARPVLTESEKRRLAQKGKELNDFLLAAVEPTWAPGTIRKWYSDLIGAKYNSVNVGQKKRGRKPVSPEIVEKKSCSWRKAILTGDMNTLPEQCGIWVTMSAPQPFAISLTLMALFLILNDVYAETGFNLLKHSSM